MGVFNADARSTFVDQSVGDSRCRLRIGDRDTLFSLAKWGERATLAFGRDGEYRGETAARGRELIVKPDSRPKETHVFRRLTGDRFEYDVVLLAEPETNRISIDMSYPEGLEFFRQPSEETAIRYGIMCPPSVIDSYAVYWKERNGPFKTGKFCHIYRPLVRDARGRTVWGTLDIDGGRMTVTIPEDWLSDAAYPVVVDPVVGTQTRGALNTIDWYNEDDPKTFYLDSSMGLNQFTAATNIAGTCTSYMYSYVADNDARAQAVLFSHSASWPASRLSRNEQEVNLERSTPAWVPSTFTLSRTVAQGETFWYGYNAFWLKTYYDVGGLFVKMINDEGTVPDTFIKYNNYTWNIIMSMYFEYLESQTYTRSISHACATAGNASRVHGVRKACTGSLGASGNVSFLRLLQRLCSGSAAVADRFEFVQALIRACTSGIMAVSRVGFVQALIRSCTTVASAVETLARSVGRSRLILSGLSFIGRSIGRMILKKEELIIVSRVTREIEFRGNLL